jgi:hypothetical protein
MATERAKPQSDPVELVLSRVKGARKNGSGWVALCPAHEDRRPSLSIGRGEGGRALLRCFAGCDFERVVAALGLEACDLFAEAPHRPEHEARREYDIRDEAGRLVAVHVRIEHPDGSKRFVWMRDGSTGLAGLKTADLPLFGAERLVRDPEAAVLVTEGEKAALAGGHLGFLAVASVTGASGCPGQKPLSALRGRNVLLWPDLDAPGREHMLRVGAALRGLARSVRVIEWPAAPLGGDAADFLNTGGTAQRARQLAEAAVPFSNWAREPECEAKPATDGSRFFVEALPAFMGRVSQMPAPRWLVPGLIPEDGCTLFHGQPRDGKTLAVLDVLLGMATGSPPFGLDRLAPERPCRVLYLTEEDSERRTHERLRLLMAGRGLSTAPDTLSLAVRRGVDLDAEDWQAAVIEAVERGRFEFVVFDPLRAFTAHADQGPADLKPFVLYLRRLMRETGCAPGLVHHDTKPRVGTPEDRKRPQRMSGGGLFSVADAPIHVERVDGSRTLLVPTAYKFSDDPRAIVYTLTPGEGSLRLVGADADADRAGELVLEERILAYLATTPGASGRAIVAAVKANRDAVYRALDRLSEAGRVDSVQKGRATHWFKAATP